MVRIPKFDKKASEAINLAPSDAEHARNVLLMAEEYIRAGKAIPPPIDKFIADAIKNSFRPKKYDQKERNDQFLLNLHLSAPRKRPVEAYWLDVGEDVFDHIENKGYGQTEAARKVGIKHSISTSSTVRLY